MSQIKKICVIGAGVMGAGIAAQIANSQTPVVLLDIMPGAAASAKDKMLLGKMPQIAHPSLMQYVTVGNLDDELALIGACDWVIEVIVEKLEIKGGLYNKIMPHMKEGAVLSSNTSTLPMKELRGSLRGPLGPKQSQLYEGRLPRDASIARNDEDDGHNFLLTHFFNPPRQMPLVELIYDDKTSEDAVKAISDFITHRLGKTIIKSNDTPGFIANRIGCFLMELCLREAYEKKLPILDIDNYFTKELGLPSTGIFGLFDLIGLDVMQMISGVLARSLSKEDEFCKTHKKYDWYDKMLADGYKGRKGLGGFYRMREADGKKIKEVLDFETMEYRHCEEGAVRRGNLSSNDDIASIIQSFFAYVNSLLGVVSSSKEDIDTAMKLGYSWKKGPFEMMREMSLRGAHSATKQSHSYEGRLPRDQEIARNDEQDDSLLRNQSAYLYEVTPKILVFSIKTKMNILDENVFNLLIESVDYAESHNAKKFIVYNEGKHFSAGANLKLFLEMGEKGDLDTADKFLELGQRAMMRVKHSKIPVIACAKGVALGGGCELLLHARKIFAHLDLSAGLVEVGVGLIPGWGGCKEMVLRGDRDNTQITKNLRNIITQNKSSSAYGFFHDYMIENGEVVMNEADLLNRAIDWDVDVEHEALSQSLPASSGMTYDNRKIDLVSSCVDLKLDDHSVFIVKELQDSINSASLSEIQGLEIERTLFKKLLIMSETLDKIRSVV